MTSGQPLAALALRHLRKSVPGDAEFVVSVSTHNGCGSPPLARVLQTANARTWTTLEMLLAGERLCARTGEDDAGFSSCLRAAMDALLGQVAPEELRRADPEWRQTCWEQLRAARQAGLLDVDPANGQESAGLPGEGNEREILRGLAEACERSAWYCMRPLLEMRTRLGEPLCVALLAWFARNTLGLEPEADFSLDLSTWDGAWKSVVELFETYSEQLEAALRNTCGALTGAVNPVPIDAMAASLRFQRGLSSNQNGEYERAIVEFSAAIQHNPTMEHAYAQRGDAHRMLGTYDRALADYSAALRLNPVNPLVLINRGKTSQLLGALQQAIGDYDLVLQLDPNSVVALNHRGTARAERGDHDAAIDDFTQALTIDPDYPFTYQNRAAAYAAQGNLDAAIIDYGRVLQLNPMFTLAYVRRADAYRQKGELKRAIADYTEALRLDPLHLHAYVNRGVAYQQQGQSNRALADFAVALKLDAANPRMFLNRGIAYRDNGEHRKALADFDAALRLDPNNYLIYLHRALAHQELKDFQSSLADLDEAIQRKPDAADAYFYRGTLHVRQKTAGLAITDLSEAVRLEPANSRAYLIRALAHSLNDDLEAVIDDCTRAIDLESSLVRAYLTRGTAYYRQNKHEQALADFNHVLELSPTDTEALVDRGMVHARLGRHDLAIAGFTQALQIAPTDARALAGRAGSYRALGQHEAALADYAQAVQHDSKYGVAYCNQRVVQHLKEGDHELALADCALSLLLQPGNPRALRLREQLLLTTAFEVTLDPAQPAAVPRETKARRRPAAAKRQPSPVPAPVLETTEVQESRPTDPEVAAQETVELTLGDEKPAQESTDTESTESLGAGAERTGDRTAAESEANDDDEQQALREQLKRESAAQQARMEEERRNEERVKLLKSRREREAQLRAQNKTKGARGDEEKTPWIRRVALAAAILVPIVFLGPSAWSFVKWRVIAQRDNDSAVAETKVTATELWNRFQTDPKSAEGEFGQKVIEVSGTVKDVRSADKDSVLIVLMGDRRDGQIVCKMPTPKSVSQGTLLSRVDRYGQVTLEGKCTGQEGKTVNLDGVRLVQVQSR